MSTLAAQTYLTPAEYIDVERKAVTNKQLRQMWLQTITTGILTVSAIVSVLKFEKVVVDITQVVKHIAQTHVLRMLAYLIFIRSATLFLFSFLFHWVSRLTLLTPFKWVGRHIVERLRLKCLPT